MAGAKSLGTLTIDLIAKVGGFTAGMSQAERAADKSAKKLKSTFAGIQSSVKKAFAFVGAGLLVREIIHNTAEAEKAFALLDNAVKQSGGAAGFTTQQLVDLSAELQRTTTFSDEAVQGAEQLLLRFQSIKGVNFEKALRSTTDLATALGTDLAGAALVVGKALENPIKGVSQLARSGVVLSEEQKKLIKSLAETGHLAEAQSLLLAELEKRYGGAAAAARNTFGGALEGLKNAFSDLLEVKGGLPEIVDQLNSLSATISDPTFKEGIDHLTSGILRLIGGIAEGLGEFGQFGDILARMQLNAPIDLFGGSISEVDKLQGELTDLNRAINNSFMGKPLKYILKNTEDLKAMRAATLAQLDALHKATGLTGGDLSAVTPGGKKLNTSPPSEEFEKLEAHLKEQIALFGSVGEAAKIAYQIQTGGLDELSSKEQQQVLALATQYDSLVRVADMAKEQIKALNDLGESIAETEKQFADMFSTGMSESDLAKELAPDFGDMLEKTEETYKESLDKMNEFNLEFQRNTVDILGTGIYDAVSGEFDNIGKAFYDMLLRMSANAVAADIAGKLFGKDGTGGGWVDKGFDWLGSLFGGGRANGGSVMGGRTYRVNENGPELLSVGGKDYLMMGSQSGSVTANPAISSGGGVNQTINVRGDVSQRSARQLQLEASRNLRVASARLG